MKKFVAKLLCTGMLLFISIHWVAADGCGGVTKNGVTVRPSSETTYYKKFNVSNENNDVCVTVTFHITGPWGSYTYTTGMLSKNIPFSRHFTDVKSKVVSDDFEEACSDNKVRIVIDKVTVVPCK